MTGSTRRSSLDLVGAAAAVGLAALCGVVVHPNRSPEIEQAVFHLLNSLPDLLYWPVWVVMQLGNLLAIPVIAVVALLFRKWTLAVSIVVAGAAKIYVSRGVKDLVTRERPTSVIDDVIRRGDAAATGEAFVSGHALIAFALAVLVHRYLPTHRRWIAWALAVGVCVGRVYVGAHLPLDVIGGGALGTAVALITRFVFGGPAPRSHEPGVPAAEAGAAQST